MGRFAPSRRRSVNSSGRRKAFHLEQLEERQLMSATPLRGLEFRPAGRTDPILATETDAVLTEFGFIKAGGGNDVDPTGPILDEPPPATSIPAYSSLPGAPVTVLLDFDGHDPIGGVIDGDSETTIPFFDIDKNGPQFTENELQAINEIWATVAEDYAPFNVNVTTVDPGLSSPSAVLRVAIGGTDFRPEKNEGGTATINAFSNPRLESIAFVFPVDKFDGTVNSTQYIATSASHEAAHAFGLFHQVLPENVTIKHPGDGNRVPILGDHESPSRAVWWQGTNSEGDSQDDMAMLARPENGFGYRHDDHSGDWWNASGMNIGQGTFRWTEPLNGIPTRFEETRGVLVGSGVIEKTSDVDTFGFFTGGGNVAIRLASPKAPGSEIKVGDLHATVRLLDANGVEIDFDGDVFGKDNKVFDLWLPEGTYYVQVGSFGEYGDVGQYTVTVAEDAGPRVVGTQFHDLGNGQLGLLVTFNETINPGSFTAHDVRIGTSEPGVGVLDIIALPDPRQFWVTLLKSNSIATSVRIGPDITDQFGNRMDQNENGVRGEATDVALASFLSGYHEGIFGREVDDDFEADDEFDLNPFHERLRSDPDLVFATL